MFRTSERTVWCAFFFIQDEIRSALQHGIQLKQVSFRQTRRTRAERTEDGLYNVDWISTV